MTVHWRYTLSAITCYFRKGLQGNIYSKSITNMDSSQNILTSTLMHQALVHLKPHFNIIKPHWIQSASLIWLTLSIPGKTPINPLPLSMRMINISLNNQRYKNKNILMMHMSLQPLRKNISHSDRSWSQLPTTYHELRCHGYVTQWSRHLNRKPRSIFQYFR